MNLTELKNTLNDAYTTASYSMFVLDDETTQLAYLGVVGNLINIRTNASLVDLLLPKNIEEVYTIIDASPPTRLLIENWVMVCTLLEKDVQDAMLYFINNTYTLGTGEYADTDVKDTITLRDKRIASGQEIPKALLDSLDNNMHYVYIYILLIFIPEFLAFQRANIFNDNVNIQTSEDTNSE